MCRDMLKAKHEQTDHCASERRHDALLDSGLSSLDILAKVRGLRRRSPPGGSSPARAGNSRGRLDARSQLPRHLLRARRRAHLGKEPVRLAELALAGAL